MKITDISNASIVSFHNKLLLFKIVHTYKVLI